jgi:hypothetical protein
MSRSASSASSASSARVTTFLIIILSTLVGVVCSLASYRRDATHQTLEALEAEPGSLLSAISALYGATNERDFYFIQVTKMTVCGPGTGGAPPAHLTDH